MTLVRRVAVRVAGFVVLHASSGCKGWAEGLAREVEFVEGDWAALGWALGSLRVLVDRRGAPIGSLEEAEESARRFFNERKSLVALLNWMVLVWNYGVVRSLDFLPLALSHRGHPWRAIYAVLGPQGLLPWVVYFCAAFFVLGRTLWVRWSSVMPKYGNPEALVLAYRGELERRYRFEMTVPGIMYQFAVASLFLSVFFFQKGGVLAHPRYAVFGALLGMMMVWRFLHAHRRLPWQVGELDGLFARRQGGLGE